MSARVQASLLVVDDDAGVVDFLCDMLGERGYRLRGLTSPRQALDAIRAESFDLVIADVEMPELRGLELVTALQRIPSAPPVLLMTAFGSIGLAVQAVRGGACDFLTKPFPIEAMYEAVARALRERQVRREVVRLRAAYPTVAQSEPRVPIGGSPAMMRALESGSVRPLGTTAEVRVTARLLAATNQPLDILVQERRLRADLYYRLNVIRIEVPALRERPEDIPLLVDYFVAQTCERLGRELVGISAAALAKLQGYPFPGNVRELANLIERAVALTEHSALLPEDIDLSEEVSLQQFISDSARAGIPLAEIERAYIQAVLKENNGNKAAAARSLSIDRSTLYRKL